MNEPARAGPASAPRRAVRLAILAALVAAGLLPAAPAPAATRIAIAPLGKATPALATQLRQSLCATLTCLPYARVAGPRGVDLAKARRVGLDAFVTGGVVRRPDRVVLELSLFTDTSFAEVTWRVPLDRRGLVPKEDLAALRTELLERLATPGAQPRPATPTVSSTPTSTPTDTPPVRVVRPPTELVVRPTPPAPTSPMPAAAPKPAEQPRPPWLAVEVGAFAGRRTLRFEGAKPGPAPLRGHEAPFIAGPTIRLELAPAALLGPGPLAGLSLFGGYATTLRLETTLDGATHDTRLSSLSAGVLWRTAPETGSRAWLGLSLSHERREAVVRPAVEGLADARLSGLRVGLSGGLPVGQVVRLGFTSGYIRWLAARDLIAGAPTFFPGGSAWALDLEAGVGLVLGSAVMVRLAGSYVGTRYRFRPDPEGRRFASGAVDEQLVGLLSVKGAW